MPFSSAIDASTWPRTVFDYVISTDEDRGENGDSKLLSRLQIDGELELRRLFLRYASRRCSFEDSSHKPCLAFLPSHCSSPRARTYHRHPINSCHPRTGGMQSLRFESRYPSCLAGTAEVSHSVDAHKQMDSQHITHQSKERLVRNLLSNGSLALRFW